MLDRLAQFGGALGCRRHDYLRAPIKPAGVGPAQVVSLMLELGRAGTATSRGPKHNTTTTAIAATS